MILVSQTGIQKTLNHYNITIKNLTSEKQALQEEYFEY